MDKVNKVESLQEIIAEMAPFGSSFLKNISQIRFGLFATFSVLLLDALFHDETQSKFSLKYLHFTISKCDQSLFQDD